MPTNLGGYIMANKSYFVYPILLICLSVSFRLCAEVTITNSVFCGGGTAEGTSSSYTMKDAVSLDTTVIGSKSSSSYSMVDGAFGYLQDVSTTSFTNWYFAEGSTAGSFDEWLLIQNPNASASVISATFMLADGTTETTDSISIPAQSRYSIHVNDILTSNAISAKITVSSGSSVMAEKAVYWNVSGHRWAGGHNTIGANETATIWYLAEGCTGDGFTEWIAIQNPNSSTSEVTISYYSDNGLETTQDIEVLPTSRYTIRVNDIITSSFVSAKIVSTNDVGIVVERALYRDSDSLEWIAGHCSIGATAAATTWYFAEGSTTGSFDEWISLFNPNSSTANIRATFVISDGSSQTYETEVPALSRGTIHVNDVVIDSAIAAKIESTNDVTFVADRAMYWQAGIIGWTGSHCSVGSSTTGTTWYLAEGCTGDSFDEWILIYNPNSTDSDVTITFMKSDATTETHDITIAAGTRNTVYVNDIVPDESVSAKVESTNGVGIVVERSQYWNAGGVRWAGGHCSKGIISE